MTESKSACKTRFTRTLCPVCGTKTKGCNERDNGLIFCRGAEGDSNGYHDCGPAVGNPAFRVYRPADSPLSNGQHHFAATFDYRDEAGVLRFQVVRLPPKKFFQRRPAVAHPRNEHKEDWHNGLGGRQPLLYRLPELLKAAIEEPVFIAEGEKDVDRLRSLGLVATTNPSGAGNWRNDYSESLRGRRVILLPDNDDAGRKHVQVVHKALSGIAVSVKIIELPDLPPKGDVSDWLDAGGTAHGLLELSAHAAEQREPLDEPKCQKWEPPLPLTEEMQVPAFPLDCLPLLLAQWVDAEATATQTPPDLAGMLAIVACAAGLAGKVRVETRPGWREPVNQYAAVALFSGERKSAVYRKALGPVYDVESQRRMEMEPIIAAKKTEHAILEARVKHLATKAAKASDTEERKQLQHDAEEAARDLARHIIPAEPELICDDSTPEKIAQLLHRQGGRILQAAPEGTPFEIAKGRYSEHANFDVYLKGHAGDPLRTGRVSRDSELIDHPASRWPWPFNPTLCAAWRVKPPYAPAAFWHVSSTRFLRLSSAAGRQHRRRSPTDSTRTIAH